MSSHTYDVTYKALDVYRVYEPLAGTLDVRSIRLFACP